MNLQTENAPVWLVILIALAVVVGIWDGVWKVIGMWRSGRNNQLAWFICIAIFNTLGILPIIYLLWFQKDRNASQAGPP